MRSSFTSAALIIGLVGGMVVDRRCLAGDRPEPPAPPGGVGTSLENCDTLPAGFVFTWETDASVLREKLLAGGTAGLPPGVTVTGITLTPQPAAIGQDESVGYYESFLLEDGPFVLSIPEGIVLSTGDFVNPAGKRAGSETGTQLVIDAMVVLDRPCVSQVLRLSEP